MNNLKHKSNKTVEELSKTGYVYRYKKIILNGLPVPETPQREGKYPDDFDTYFDSKEDFNQWYKQIITEYAKLDECLNYCKHFIREKGNKGNYVRNGKTYPVDGTWCSTHDYGRGESGKFFTWVKENFGNNWYELMERYEA